MLHTVVSYCLCYNYMLITGRFLNLIPFTALAALICPGVLTVDPNIWYIGLAGAIVAAALAWKKVPLGAIVIITVIALIILYSVIPYFGVIAALFAFI